jgi:ribosomal protein L17
VKQAALVAQKAKLLTDKRLLAAVSFIGSTQAKLRPSLIRMGESFDRIHRIAGDLWNWWLSNNCQQQTGISPTCAKEYEGIFHQTRLQTEDNLVAQGVFEQADTSKPRNIDTLNRTLESKLVQTQIAAAGSDSAKVQKVVESVIAQAKAAPVSTERTEAVKFDSVFERLAKSFADIAVPINPTKTQVAESRRLARVFRVRIEGLAETLHLESAGFSLTIRPTKG